jgi:hypothetical protein
VASYRPLQATVPKGLHSRLNPHRRSRSRNARRTPSPPSLCGILLFSNYKGHVRPSLP